MCITQLLLLQPFYGSLDFVWDYPVSLFQNGKTRKVKPVSGSGISWVFKNIIWASAGFKKIKFGL